MKHIKNEDYQIILILGMVTHSMATALLVKNMDKMQWIVKIMKRKLEKIPLKRQCVGYAIFLGKQQVFVTL